ncbi:MAG: beta-lactamase family protein [Armatimonadetes bacterium]|nr:beta-lactamase family protein [Armatimonadota bacterium]
MARQKIPGVALLMTRHDKVIKNKAYGICNLELNVPVTTSMLFESGSIGKTFTSTIIMQLWEQGKISLDDPISKYIEHTPDAWKDIKIRNMLGHTSGLKDYALVEGIGLADHWTTEQWFAKMNTLSLDFPTGTAFAYSNSNYLLLGLIAQKITGKPITDLIIERIFKPLGMNHSLESDGDPIIPNRATGYWESDNVMINEIKIGHGYGDGGWINTCEDLAKFERGLREGKLVKPETLSLMRTPGVLPTGRKTPYGFGWFVRTVNGHQYISHGGNTGGFGSSIFRVPEKDLTIIVMTNLASVVGDVLAQQIAEAYSPDLLPKPIVESPDPNPDFSKTLKEALVELANRKTTQDIFDPEMKARLSTGRGQMVLERFAPFKAIESFAYCQTEASDPDTTLTYRVKAGGKSYIVTFVVTKEKKLFQVGMRPDESPKK